MSTTRQLQIDARIVAKNMVKRAGEHLLMAQFEKYLETSPYPKLDVLQQFDQADQAIEAKNTHILQMMLRHIDSNIEEDSPYERVIWIGTNTPTETREEWIKILTWLATRNDDEPLQRFPLSLVYQLLTPRRRSFRFQVPIKRVYLPDDEADPPDFLRYIQVDDNPAVVLYALAEHLKSLPELFSFEDYIPDFAQALNRLAGNLFTDTDAIEMNIFQHWGLPPLSKLYNLIELFCNGDDDSADAYFDACNQIRDVAHNVNNKFNEQNPYKHALVHSIEFVNQENDLQHRLDWYNTYFVLALDCSGPVPDALYIAFDIALTRQLGLLTPVQ